MISGATPPTAKPAKRASGARPSSFSTRSLTRMDAPAPSDICELLPAVTDPRAANTGRSLPSPSSVVSGRGPSSRSTTLVRVATFAAARSGTFSRTGTATISASNSPAICAASAFWCDASAKASWSSRDTFQRSATFSAVSPMP